MDINNRENVRCMYMYIIKYRCLSALADPEGGKYPARAPLNGCGPMIFYAPNAKFLSFFTALF